MFWFVFVIRTFVYVYGECRCTICEMHFENVDPRKSYREIEKKNCLIERQNRIFDLPCIEATHL